MNARRTIYPRDSAFFTNWYKRQPTIHRYGGIGEKANGRRYDQTACGREIDLQWSQIALRHALLFGLMCRTCYGEHPHRVLGDGWLS